MYYLTSCPDDYLFLWQLQMQHKNFIEVGIDLNKVIVVVSYRDVINPRFIEYSEKSGVTFIFYADTIRDRKYIPTIRPFLFKRFHQDNPQFKHEYILYHDSDITFREVPFFEGMKDYRWHLGDCVGYIGYQYLKTIGEDTLDKMCLLIGLFKDTLISKNLKSGGAQYFGKGLGFDYWSKVETDSEKLYFLINKVENDERNYQALHNTQLNENIIQSWTAGMWAELWNIWLSGFDTYVDPELDFSWGNHSKEQYAAKNIFHNSGVNNNTEFFHKGSFINVNPFEFNFNHINSNSAAFTYLELCKRTKQWLQDLNCYYVLPQ
jgi:hypothetical protein